MVAAPSSRLSRTTLTAGVCLALAGFGLAIPGGTAGAQPRGDRPDTAPATATVRAAASAKSNIVVDEATLECPDFPSTTWGVTCSGTASVTNLGPAGPTTVHPTLALTAPSTCTVAVANPPPDQVILETSQQAKVSGSWTVTCAKRGIQRVGLVARALPTDASDPVRSNNKASTTASMTVSEPAYIRLYTYGYEDVARPIRCSPWPASTSARTTMSCRITAMIENSGPATDVRTVTRMDVEAEAPCTASLISPVRVTLAKGQTARVVRATQLTCPPGVIGGLNAELDVGYGEPGLWEDWPIDNLYVVGWTPFDVEPGSSRNVVDRRQTDSVRFALLGTPKHPATWYAPYTFWLQVGPDFSTVDERACDASKDVNADGVNDLVCQMPLSSIDVPCGRHDVSFTGGHSPPGRNGGALVGHDVIRIAGCAANGRADQVDR